MNTKEEYNFYEATMKCTKGTQIGSGANGKVYECSNNKTFVIKEVTKAEHLENEKKFITYDKKCKYKHVAKMYNVESNDNALIIQKVDNILDNILSNRFLHKIDLDNIHSPNVNLDAYKLKEDQIKDNEEIISKLIKSLDHLHKEVNYSHNDIKPSNIGYNMNKEIKFIDMGSSELINNDKENKPLETLGYTVMYASPSTISDIFTNYKRDNWALAATIYEIVAGIPLFHILSKHLFPVFMTLILNVNNEAKIKYLLGMDENVFPILSPYINEREIVQRHLGVSRMFFAKDDAAYKDKKSIVDYIFKAFKDDVDLNYPVDLNNQMSGGDETGLQQARWQSVYEQKHVPSFVDKKQPVSTSFVDKKQHVSTSFVEKENPLLGKEGDIYDFDEKTGKITIKKLSEWKNIIKEIKNDIKLYESSEQYPKDVCTYYNKSPENQTQLLVKGGTIYERKVITENKYNKEKMKKNNHVSRYKLKNGKFVYYMKKIRM
jgi:serine/threonine protein kinase